MSAIAFYADCHHEVSKVTSGYRVALTFNLLHNPEMIPHPFRNAWVIISGMGGESFPDYAINWKGGVSAIQNQLNLKVHVAGKSAFKIDGISHFALPKKETVVLFAKQGVRLPKWLRELNCPEEIQYFTISLFKTEIGILSKKVDQFTLKISSRESII